MTKSASKVIEKLQGRTLATAESCTGGAIGAVLTSVPGASKVYKGGVVSYCDEIKEKMLGVSGEVLSFYGAVSPAVAEAMAKGARNALETDIAVSVTGLAGPDGDAYGNPVGTVFVGYSDEKTTMFRRYMFMGSREEIRAQAVEAALMLVLEYA